MAAATFAATGPAVAKPIIKEHFTDNFTSKPYDCVTADGTVVHAQDAGSVQVILMANLRGTGRQHPFPYFRESDHGTVVTTNLDTGGTLTQVFTGNFTDHKIIDNGDGTITIVSQGAGSARYYDQFGNFVLKDPGMVRFSIDVDYNGTPADPDDDVSVPGSFQIVKPSTGHSDFSDRDFCQDLLTFTS
jgi:hypothetical protein